MASVEGDFTPKIPLMPFNESLKNVSTLSHVETKPCARPETIALPTAFQFSILKSSLTMNIVFLTAPVILSLMLTNTSFIVGIIRWKYFLKSENCWPNQPKSLPRSLNATPMPLIAGDSNSPIRGIFLTQSPNDKNASPIALERPDSIPLAPTRSIGRNVPVRPYFEPHIASTYEPRSRIGTSDSIPARATRTATGRTAARRPASPTGSVARAPAEAPWRPRGQSD